VVTGHTDQGLPRLTQAEPMAKFVDRQDCREFSGESL